MLFKEIPGQHTSKEYLSKLIEEDRVPHAMLFTGPNGNGKLAFALAFAAALQCENAKGIEACGNCSPCNKSLKYIHPDLHFAFPVCSIEGKKREETISTAFLPLWRNFVSEQVYGGIRAWSKFVNAENKTLNINVTECNYIIKSLGLRKYEGKYKIQIIWGAEFLSKEGNRLLKLIEEPTPDTIIILIADNQDMVLNTIKSRCQIVKIPPFQDEDVTAYLDSKNLDSNQKKEIVRLAAGNLRVVDELITDESNDWDDMLLSIFRYSYTNKISEMLKFSEKLSSLSKKEMEGFCLYCLHFLKEYIRVVNLNSVEYVRLSQKEKNTALKMTKSISADMAFEIAGVMEENLRNIHRNANKKIMWTATMFNIEEIFNRKKLAS